MNISSQADAIIHHPDQVDKYLSQLNLAFKRSHVILKLNTSKIDLTISLK